MQVLRLSVLSLILLCALCFVLEPSTLQAKWPKMVQYFIRSRPSYYWKWGCLMTSAAMMISGQGVTIRGQAVTPPVLNQWLTQNNRYFDGDRFNFLVLGAWDSLFKGLWQQCPRLMLHGNKDIMLFWTFWITHIGFWWLDLTDMDSMYSTLTIILDTILSAKLTVEILSPKFLCDSGSYIGPTKILFVGL